MTKQDLTRTAINRVWRHLRASIAIDKGVRPQIPQEYRAIVPSSYQQIGFFRVKFDREHSVGVTQFATNSNRVLSQKFGKVSHVMNEYLKVRGHLQHLFDPKNQPCLPFG